jgi:hypothetical protein
MACQSFTRVTTDITGKNRVMRLSKLRRKTEKSYAHGFGAGVMTTDLGS